MKSIYFISDAHLGCRALSHERQRERCLVHFLDDIKKKAQALYLLGDMFDFWFEYKNVVPKGFTRFLGKLGELTDNGVDVHYFIGNHDIWCRDYLSKECGVIMHYEPVTLELGDKLFHIGHGDGLGDSDNKFKFLRAVFHNRFCQWLFSGIHPSWGVEFGLRWAKRSHIKHHIRKNGQPGGDPPYLGEDKENLVLFAKEYLMSHPDINYFIFGHRHIELDLMLTHTARILILGDWMSLCTYAVFDGERLSLDNYVEGESKM